jgi:hypothetical protein
VFIPPIPSRCKKKKKNGNFYFRAKGNFLEQKFYGVKEFPVTNLVGINYEIRKKN